MLSETHLQYNIIVAIRNNHDFFWLVSDQGSG